MFKRRTTAAIVLALALAGLALIGCAGSPTPVIPATRTPQSLAAPGGQVASFSGTIEGVVVDAVSGKPLEKVSIRTNPDVLEATTDAEGKFSIGGVPVGVHNVEASLAGYDTGFEGNLSVVAGGTRKLSIALRPSAPYPLADIRSVWASEGETLPDQRVWITLGAGYANHDNEKIKTTGLSNVPVGTYVYLAGREQDGAGKPISNWAWKVTGPGGEEVAVENAATRTPRFLANKEGKYQIVVGADLDGGVKGEYTLTVNAGHYVGAETCESCHNGSVMPDTYSQWHATGHGTKLETTFGSYTAERDYCIGCHVTGYNEASNAGGFDALARQAGWDPAQGSLTAWLLNNNWTIDKIMQSPMGKLANVQCEACHGPGSAHTASLAYDPGVCEQCHEQGSQWANSGHALTGWKNSHTAGNAACVKCHTGEGYVKVQIRGEQPVFPSMATPLKKANLVAPGEQPQIACAACHDPHQATEPGENGASKQLRQSGEVMTPVGVKVQAGEAATCVSCHADNRTVQYKEDFAAGKMARATHENPQVDVLFGLKESAFDFGEGLVSSPHSQVAKDLCITCHMAANPVLDPGPDGQAGTRDDVTAKNVGGHSFSMAAEVEGKGLVQNTGSCEQQGCHAQGSITSLNREARADYDGDGKVEGVQDEVKGLLDLLAAQLPKDENGAVLESTVTADNTTEIQRQAIWNYWLIEKDGSYGIHNTGFAVQLLQQTYKHLTGNPVPNATIR